MATKRRQRPNPDWLADVPVEPTLPLEIVVTGPPVSVQSKSKDRVKEFKERIIQAASEQWPNEAIASGWLSLCVTHYYQPLPQELLQPSNSAPDVDNIIWPAFEPLNQYFFKSVQDCLNGRVISDDFRLQRSIGRRYPLNRPISFRGNISEQFMKAFVYATRQGGEFVHVILDEAETPETFAINPFERF